MSDYHDRRAVDEDEKQRILDLTTYKFVPPDSDIQEGDLYYYACNPEWAKIIDGHVSWLASIAAWPEAENEDYIAIQQILKFLRRVEIPMPPDFDCGDVEDCLGESAIIADIIDSIGGIEQGGSQSGNPNNTDKPPTQGASHETGNEAAFEPDDCGDSDRDKLWGAISDFVDFCHSVNLDFFQQISAYTSRAKLLGTVISAIPLFGLLPIDEAVSAAAQLADFVSVDYNASVTTVGLYEIKCDLFCQAVANGCYFDVNTAFNYFLDNDGISGINADSTFEDYAANIASGFSVTGNEVFCLMSAWQLAVASLGEKFGNASGMAVYTKAAQAGALSPDSGWQAWCDECPVEDGDWTLVLDFANDYVPEEDEIVYRNAFNLLRESTAFSTTGASTISQQYASGLIYNSTGGSNKFKNQELRISNAGALFKQLEINALLDDGTATQFTIDTDSNTYNPPPRQFSSGAFSWSSAVGVANVAGTPGSVTRIALNFTQVSSTNTCQGLMRYIRITGTGERPRFI
jgi:hypothetical protein